jgi:hypothetical protein
MITYKIEMGKIPVLIKILMITKQVLKKLNELETSKFQPFFSNGAEGEQCFDLNNVFDISH